MKTRFLACLLLLFPLLSSGAENLFKNGDFDRPGSWQGDGRIIADKDNDQNKVYLVDLSAKDRVFKQLLKLDGKQNKVKVTYRVRATADYKSKNPGIAAWEMVLSSPKTTPLIGQRNISKKGEWVSFSMNYECVGAKELLVTVTVRPGEGGLEFDDFTATAQ